LVLSQNDAAGRRQCSDVTKRNPGFAEAHNNLGLALMQGRDAPGAQAEFREAVRLKPRYAEAHYNLALALHQEGKEAESRAELEKAYEIAPELRNAAGASVNSAPVNSKP
jgi:tetratricopeptide (TPR) repeat protein